jgi:hypothetical protein
MAYYILLKAVDEIKSCSNGTFFMKAAPKPGQASNLAPLETDIL